MNFHQDEFTAQYNRQRVKEEFDQLRIGQLTARPPVYRPGLFTRTMYNFANWMIATGKQLRKRYEIPTITCKNPSTNSFAR